MKRAASLYKIDDVLLRYTEEQLQGENLDGKSCIKTQLKTYIEGETRKKDSLEKNKNAYKFHLLTPTPYFRFLVSNAQ